MASDILLKIGSIVLLLGGLIFVHEFGHFLAAKALGVKVVKFSIGFGPKILGFRRGETEYLLSILPLGGYVKMAGDEPGAEVAPEDKGRGFLEARPWKRFVIAFAGPAANLIFPVVIYFALALAQNGSNVPGPTLGTVMPGSAAERQECQHVLGLAAAEAEEAGPEADGELHHLHPEQLGRDEVAELVDEDETPEEEDDRADLEEDVAGHVVFAPGGSLGS